MNKPVRPQDISVAQNNKSVDELLRGFKSGISYRTLESRIAFDGAAAATAATAVDAQQDQAGGGSDGADVAAAPEAAQNGATNGGDAESPDDLAVALQSNETSSADMRPATIVFVDSAVENIDQIISSIDPNFEIVLLSDQSSGLEQIATHLYGRSDVGSIHIVSHGEVGTLYLGSETLNTANLADHQAQLTAIGDALSDSGDILLYGCEVANGTGGMDFVRAFSAMTEADVAASINNTGGDESNGDWVLEATNGAIEAKSLSNPLYAGLLVKTNTGAWTANGATTANDWQNTTDGITTTVTFTNGTASTYTGVANGTLPTATAANGLTAATYDNGALGAASLGFTYNSTAATDGGTVTITFSSAVTNPVIHLDRLGGFSGAVGQSNSSVWTLATPGASLTRLSGVNHFVVDSVAGTFQRRVGDASVSNGEADSNTAEGTAAGSVRVNGTFTTLTFNLQMSIPAGGTAIGDGLELAFAIDAPPVAVNDTFTTVHDTPVTINVRANDTDVRSDTLTVTKVNGTSIVSGGPGVAVTGGVVTLVSGNLVFTPTANYAGSPSFTYAVADANGGESTATVNGTVTNVAPVVDLNGDPAVTVLATTAFSQPNADAGADRSNTFNLSLTGDILPDTTEGLFRLSEVDNSFRILVNGTSVHSSTAFNLETATAGEVNLRFADLSSVATPWEPNTNGLSRVEVRLTETGVRFFATRTTTSTVLEELFPSAGTFNLPNFVSGANTVTFVNVNGAGVEEVFGTFAATAQSANFTTTFTENGAPVSIADTDAFTTDADDSNLGSAAITLTNPQTGDRLLVNGLAATTGTIGTITWTRTDTSVTFAGSATKAQYAAAIQQVQFENTTDTPSTTPRTINTTVNDGTVNSNTAVTTINIDRAPDPVNDAFSGNEDTAISANVLTNDTDTGDGPAATPLSLVTGPTNGVLTSFNLTTGAFVYTPAANFNGTDTFTYRYTDVDGDSKTATVTLTVNPINDVPTQVVPASIGPTTEDAALAITGITVADVDSSTLTTSLTVTNGQLNLASLAGVTVTGDGSGTMTIAGTAAAINAALTGLSFTPTADYNGSATFTVATTDGALTTATATRTITVSAVADISNDSVTTNEDAPVTFAPLGNDSFENAGRTITAIEGSPIIAGGAGVSVTGGVVTLDASGNLTYTPNANFNGTPSFTYTVTSGGVTEVATVNMTVTAVNDAPTQTVPTAQTTNEDTAVVITGASVADVDGGTLTTTISVPVGTGVLSVPAGGGATIAGSGSRLVTISGTAAQVNSAIASITYTPTADYNGAAPLTISTTDGTATTANTVSVTVTPVADITNDAVSTNEDVARTFNVIGGTNGATADTFEGTPSVTSVTQPTSGSVTFLANGSITYTPSSNFNGTDSFTYTVTSGGVTETATVTVTVAAVNDAPLNTVPGAQTTTEDTSIVFSAANGNAITVSDVDSNLTTTLTVANGVLTLGSMAGVTVTGNGTGTVTVSGAPAAITAALSGLAFSPTADFNGTATLNVSTSDGVAPATVSSVGITISAVVDIAPDSVSTPEDTPRTFNVLTNDSFENAGATVSSVTQPANGSVTIGSGGDVTYTPSANYSGSDSFTYTVTSGGVSETTTVTLSVTAVNDAPVADDETGTTNEDTTLTVPAGSGLLVGDADIDGGALSVSQFTVAGVAGTFTAGSSASIPAVGTLQINADGSYVFSPVLNYNGPVPVATYTVIDGNGSSDTGTLTIAVTPVNDAPVADDDTGATNEDTTLTVPAGAGLLVGDTDVDGNTLSVTQFTVAGIAGSFTAGATATITGVGTLQINSDGSYTFAPAANYNGAVPVATYTVSDGNGGTDTGTLTLSITPVNDAPVADDETGTTAEDTTLTVSAGSGLLVGDTDLDGDTLAVSQFTVAGVAGSFTAGTTATIASVGTLQINADGSYVFTPVANYFGPVPVATYTVVDGNGGTDTGTLTLAVTSVNDAPVADDETGSIAEDNILNVSAAAGLLIGDTDVEGNALTVTQFTVSGVAGTFAAGSSATITGVGVLQINADGSYTFTPALNYNGAVPVATYTVSDGNGGADTGTLTITVTPVNDAPIADDEAVTASEDVTLSVPAGAGLLVGDTDADGDTLTVTQFAVSGVAGTFTAGSTATIPAVGTLRINADGSYVFTPAANYNGPVPVATYTVSDSNGGTDAGTLTITISAVNDAPVATDDTNSISEDTTLTVNAAAGLLSNDTDAEGATLVVTQFTVAGVAGTFTAGASAVIPGVGTLTINGSGAYTFVPDANYNGGVPVATYTISDGSGGTDTGTLTLVVTPVNDAPVADDETGTTLEDTTLNVPAGSGLLIGDTDVEGNALTITQFTVSGVAGTFSAGSSAPIAGVGSLTINGNGSYTFVPAANYNGPVPVATYTVSDSNGGTDTGTLTLAVTPVNDAPIAVDDTGSTNEDTTLTIGAAAGLLANDTDVEGNTLSITQFTIAGSATVYSAGSSAIIAGIGTLTINANGSYTFVPALDYVGPVPLTTYTVVDGAGGTDTGTLALAVSPDNDAPVNTVPGPQSIAEDTPTAISGISVADLDADPLTTTLTATNGTLTVALGGGATISGAGTGVVTISGTAAEINAALAGLTFTNVADYNGPATLTVATNDGYATDTDVIAITVTPVADITADTVSGTEDASISFNVVSGTNGATPDTFEGSPSVTSYTQPANGSVVIAADGSVTYTPNGNFNGVDTFTYTVTSGAVTETTTVTVNVAAANDSPMQTLPPAQNGTEDTAVVFSGANGNQIILNDIDAGASVTTTISVPAGSLAAIATAGVTITGNGTGTVMLSGTPAAVTAALNGLAYTPVSDFNGTVVMTVATTDGIAPTINGTVSIALASVADIQNDNASINEDVPATVSVLSNDTFENAGRTVTSVTNGSNGTVTINGDGTVTYTPNANFNGSDSFTYTVTSGGVSESATVIVVVNPTNDAATQITPPAQTTTEDTSLVFGLGTGNAITVADIDGDALTTTVSVTNGTLDLGSVVGVTVTGDGTGIVTISGSASAINTALDGLTYQPTADFNGSAVMSIATTDGVGTVSGTVAITVSAVADIVSDGISTNEDTSVAINVLANDNFENSGAAVSSVTQPANGMVSIGSGGQLTYTPNANFNGSDSFTYTVTSGGMTETTTVSVTVVPVNDALVTTVPASQSTSEDTPLLLSTSNGNAITVADLDGDAITMTVSATNGLLTLGSTVGVTVSGNGTGTVTVSGSAAALNTALNGLSFAPTADYNGAAAISVTATDGNASTSNTIAVTINPVVDVVANTASTAEDTSVTLNVLSNDNFESPGRTLTSVTQGSSGTVSFLADGTVVYNPNTGFFGVDTFSYTATSNGTTETTTVTINVGSVNDAPTTVGLADRSNLDGNSVSVDVSSSFFDSDAADTLTYSASGLPAGLTINSVTGIITGTIDKNASQLGPYTVTVTASDGNPGGTVATAFTWNVANPGPTANNDAATVAEDSATNNIAVLANDTDPDMDPLTVTAATAGNGVVTILGNGTINYQPNADFNGTDTIVYQINDGNGGMSTATVTVTVTPVNDAPTTTGLGDLTDADSQVVNIDVSGAFSDLDGDTLTYSITGLPPGLSFNPTTGEIVGTIDPGASQPSGDASYPISVTASDGNGGMVTTSFTWRVLNLPPTANDDSVTTPEDTPVVATVLANDVDPDGDPLTITQINGLPITLGGPAVLTGNGSVVLQSDAFGNDVLVFTPNADFNGVETLVYTTSDGNSGTDTATLTINVVPQNDAPTADTLANLSNDDSDVVSIDLMPFFHDVDAPNGDTLTFSIVGLPAGLSIDPVTGIISGTLDSSASQVGPYVVVVTAEDSVGEVVSQSFTWTVNNPAPTAVADLGSTPETTALTVGAPSGVLTNDSDPDGDTLVVSAINGSGGDVGQPVAGSAGGLFTVNSDGSYSFDPNGAFEDLQVGDTRQTTISYTVADADGRVSVADLTITVTGVNDAPVATSIASIATVDSASLTVNAATAFSDVDGDTLTYSATGLPVGLTINPVTGVISGTVDKSASQGGTGGVYTVTITANDGNGATTPTTLMLTVTNPAPTAGDNTAAVVEDTPSSGNVLLNDVDPDGDTLSVTGFTVAGIAGAFNPGDTATIAGVGTITIAANGVYTFSPATNYTGTVPQITYAIADGNGGTDTATLNLGPVSPTNDAPTSTAISPPTHADNATVTFNVAPNFSDVDGDALSFAAAGLPPGLTIDPATGVVTGTIDHLASASGPYSVTVTATDPSGATTQRTFTWTVTNPAPVGPAISNSTGVDNTAVSIAAGSGFSDPDGDTLTFSVTGLPAGLTINAGTGVISGTLSRSASVGGPSSNGVYTIAVTATDSQGALVTRAFTYTVSNPPPAAGADAFTGVEDTAIVGAVSGNDSDPDGDVLTYSVVTGPTKGTLAFNANGTFTYTPNANVNSNTGNDTFSYRVTDANGATATAIVTLTVTPVNDAPISVNFAATTPEDQALTGTLTATDVDGDPVTFAKATDPTNGTVIVNTNGTYTYTPNANYNGPDSFTYTVSDGNGGAITRTVSITVTPVNDAPVALNNIFTVAEDGSVSVPVLGNDSDIDGDTLTVTAVGATPIVEGQTVAVANGTVRLTGGQLVFAPAANYFGPASFSYTISDGTTTAVATVSGTVTSVNDVPVANNDTATTAEDTPVTISVLGNDTDADGNTLTVSHINGTPIAVGGSVAVTGGTVTRNANGTLTFTPNANFNGTPSFDYTVSDGNGGTDTATVSLTVTPVNDVPVANNDTATTAEDTPVTISVLGNDTDADGNPLTVSHINGTPIAVGGSVAVTGGTVTRNANGTLTFTPNLNFNGTPSFDYTVSDGNGGTDTATVSLTVTPVNDVPVANNDTATTAEDTPVTISVLGNDTDADGNPLTVSHINGTPVAVGGSVAVTGGTVTRNANGTLTFTPNANFNGTPSFVYTVSDGNGGTDTATVSLTVTPVNDVPVANNDIFTVSEDGSVSVPVLGNDTDVEGNPLIVIAVNGTSIVSGQTISVANGTVTLAGGQLVFTPVANYFGPASFTYTITDGTTSATASVSGTVTPVNDAPVAVNDAFTGAEDTVVTGDVTPGTVGQDRDVDGNAIAVVDTDSNPSNGITPVSGPAHGSLVLNANGTFSYTPNANYNGADSFTYRISDGQGGFAEATVVLTINPVNDAPLAANDSLTTPEDAPFSGTLPPASDVDGNAVTYVKASDPLNGSVVVNANGTYVYTPNANYNGPDSFTYSVLDGQGAVVTYTVTVLVTPTDDMPVIAPIVPPLSRDSGTIVFDVTPFVTDVDGDDLTFTATGLPPGLTINPATGLISGTITRDASQGGPYAVTLTVDDGNGGIVTQTFNWPVTNPAPIARDDSASVDVGKDVTVSVLANDNDPDGDVLTVTSAQAMNGTVEILADGSIKYTPQPGFIGVDRITYVINDGNGGTAIASVTISVADDMYNEKPPVFGFNGPEQPQTPTPFATISPIVPITVDGAVVDAVFDIGSLRSMAAQIGANGAVLAAANGARSLDGLGTIGESGIVVETVRNERARDILFRAGFDRSFQDYRIDGLPGFSLRNNVPGNIGGLSAREQIVIESLVRDETLILQISNTIESGSKRIVDYRVTQSNGQPLPQWLDHAAKDLLIGRRDANWDILKIKVEAVYSDGSVVVEEVIVDTATGEIQPLKVVTKDAVLPRMFGDQFNAPAQLTPDQIQGLSKIIAR